MATGELELVGISHSVIVFVDGTSLPILFEFASTKYTLPPANVLLIAKLLSLSILGDERFQLLSIVEFWSEGIAYAPRIQELNKKVKPNRVIKNFILYLFTQRNLDLNFVQIKINYFKISHVGIFSIEKWLTGIFNKISLMKSLSIGSQIQ